MSKALTVLKETFIPVPPTHIYKTSYQGEALKESKFDDVRETEYDENDDVSTTYEVGYTHRRLTTRMVQLFGLGGTIGVSLFTSIGTIGLYNGGPLSLLLGFSMWCVPVLVVTSCCAEMVCYLPIPGAPFTTFAARFVDEAFGFMSAWNFWVLECALIPFELTLFNTLCHYWRDDYNAAIPISIELVLYFMINVAAVKWYGEVEFWLCMGKVILALGLLFFTFITMVGGNPQGDVYGFRNWAHSPMLEYINTGALGRFQGWLSCLITASYMIAGPEYVSMTAGEVVNPRKVLPNAFRQVFYRLTFFFIGGALCVGIVCNARDPVLLRAIANGLPGAGSSPYTIAMYNMKISVLPDIVNVLLITSCFSAGNSYVFCSSRTLYGLAQEGKAPSFLKHCNKQGVPIYAVIVSLCWGFLAFLQLSESANTVLNWIINLVTASQLINYCVILFTYLHFRRAVKVQGLDRAKFTFKAHCQPYSTVIVLFVILAMVGVQGYTVFLDGKWSVETFLFCYLMVFIDIAIFISWKVIKRTKYQNKPDKVDLYSGLEEIEAHERYIEREELACREAGKKDGFLEKVSQLIFGK